MGPANAVYSQNSQQLQKAIVAARFAQILKLTAPPPNIGIVNSITNSLQLSSNEADFKTVVANAQSLIEEKQHGR
jgi:hypothetical protein